MKTAEGETSFAVLLFQDIAVIPILIIMPLLASATTAATVPHEATLLALFPAWIHPIIVTSVIGAMIVAGHFFQAICFLLWPEHIFGRYLQPRHSL